MNFTFINRMPPNLNGGIRYRHVKERLCPLTVEFMRSLTHQCIYLWLSLVIRLVASPSFSTCYGNRFFVRKDLRYNTYIYNPPPVERASLSGIGHLQVSKFGSVTVIIIALWVTVLTEHRIVLSSVNPEVEGSICCPLLANKNPHIFIESSPVSGNKLLSEPNFTRLTYYSLRKSCHTYLKKLVLHNPLPAKVGGRL